ncbi:DUF86 domain-containing protein [Moorella naiadis]|uniref:type VII toxin-antitoxin system HepT family RNase toxin n=1 Tax=Moorella naiadis (nom. illeg.) TaxID=3093670 RepID=UPI003D9C9A85
MFNEELIAERLGIIQRAMQRLQLLASLSREQFLQDEDTVDIAENRLRRALEALFDLGRHIVVKSGLAVPADYRTIIERLRDNDILPSDFAPQILGMAGYRNRLVHEYNKVTPAELYEILQNRLGDFTVFCQHIVNYLEKVSRENSQTTDGK